MNYIYPITFKEIENEAIKLAKESSRQAKTRTERNIYYKKKGIQYKLKQPKKIVKQFKNEIPDKWNSWIELTKKFIYSGKNPHFRPTIDRINSNGDYVLDNIAFLPFYEHILKDKAVKVRVFDILKKDFIDFNTMTQAGKYLSCSKENISQYCDSGRLYKNQFIIQSGGERKGKSKNKRTSIQKKLAVTTLIMNEYDDKGNVIRTFPIKSATVVEFNEILIKKV